MKTIQEKIKQLSIWRNHSCLYCEACNICHKCNNIPCQVKNFSKALNQSRIGSTNITSQSNAISVSNESRNELTSNNNQSSTSNDNDCLSIDWKLQIYNNKFVYGINPAFNNHLFFLGQYTGPELNLGTITLFSPTSSVFFSQVNTDGEIVLAHNLWTYDGIREDYQFGQLSIDGEGNLIVLTTFVGTLNFNNGQTISEDDGNTMIGKFFQTGQPVWIRQLTAKSIEDIYFTLDSNNNIYIVGTFTGTLSVSDPDSPLITSNLESNMFIGRINSNGSTQWLITAIGTGYNTGEGITFYENNIVAIGTFNETFILDGETLVNNDAFSNMWVAKLNLNGDLLNLTSPIHPNNNQETDLIDGGQIISHRGNLYIAGELLGNFIFSDIDIDVELKSVFVAELNTDLDFLWISLLQVDIPTDNSLEPKLTAAENRIILSNFGIGTVHYLNDNGQIDFRRKGSGSLDQIISELSLQGNWLDSLSICGTVENFSIPLIANNNNVFLIGTHAVNNERTDAFLVNILL